MMANPPLTGYCSTLVWSVVPSVDFPTLCTTSYMTSDHCMLCDSHMAMWSHNRPRSCDSLVTVMQQYVITIT